MDHIVPLHGKGLLMSLILLGALGAWLSRPPQPIQPTIVDIAVEHQGKLVLSLKLTTKSGAGLLDIATQSASGILLSLPQQWIQTEVRNTSLASVTAADAAFGFNRWNVPANAGLTYRMNGAPDRFRVLNPREEPMEVRLQMINLDRKSVENRSVLFTDSEAILP